jgi:hypothetical protein
VLVADPFAVTDVGSATTVDCPTVAAPAVPVAVNVVEIAGSLPVIVAVNVFAPAVAPNVHAGDVATPDAFVVTVAGVPNDPPPVATANVTDTPATGLLFTSRTSTLGAVATAAPATAVWSFPASIAICVAAPGVMLKVFDVAPASEPDVADKV